MTWIRSHIRPAAHLALLALALQLVLSFGHVHVDHGRLAAAAGVTVQAKADPDPGAPAKHHPADDFCAICANIALAGTLAMPAAPTLTLPPAIETAWLRPADMQAARHAAQHFFQARAPP